MTAWPDSDLNLSAYPPHSPWKAATQQALQTSRQAHADLEKEVRHLKKQLYESRQREATQRPM